MIKTIQLTLLLFLTACSLVSTKLEPAPLPNDWKWESEENAKALPPQVDEWWHIFNDPVLNELEVQALASSPTLEIALYKVEQARAVFLHSWADLFPNLSLAPSFFESGQLVQNPVPIAGTPPAIRFHTQTYQVPFKLTFEPDLFGRLLYHEQADYATLEAQRAAYYAARLLLTANVALSYFTVRADITKIHILEQTILRRQAAYEVNKARFDAGQVNYTDVSQADFQRQRAQVDLKVIQEDKAKQENLLSRLTTVYNLPEMEELKTEPPIIPAGIPSEVLLRRPNLIDAQYQMLSDALEISSKNAALYPQFLFTGYYGRSSPDFGHIFDWIALFWSWQLEMAQTIFDFGRKLSDIDEARSIFMQSASNYRELVLEAFQEVEDALSGTQLIKQEIVYIRKSIEAAEISISLFRERYLRGLVNYLEVVTSEEDLLTAQQNEADAVLRLNLATINLIKAIGGSFPESSVYVEDNEPEENPAAPSDDDESENACTDTKDQDTQDIQDTQDSDYLSCVSCMSWSFVICL